LILPLGGGGPSEDEVRRWWRGDPFIGAQNDQTHRSLQIIEHVSGSNAECSHTVLLKIQVAPRVPFYGIAALMCFTVDFDDHLRVMAVEISDIAARGVLPPKLQTFGSLPKLLPEQNLRETHGAP
jgi:hypothetical protein